MSIASEALAAVCLAMGRGSQGQNSATVRAIAQKVASDLSTRSLLLLSATQSGYFSAS